MRVTTCISLSILCLLGYACCDDETYSFTEEQRQLAPTMEVGTKSLLISDRDTIEFEVIRVTNDFLNGSNSSGPCTSAEEVSWTEFSNGTAFYLSARDSGFEMTITVSLSSVFKEYRIRQQGSAFNLVDEDESVISEGVIHLLRTFSIGTSEFDDVVQITETGEDGTLRSELLYQPAIGILQYSEGSVSYTYQEYF